MMLSFQQQDVRAYFETVRYSLNIVDRNVALAPLDAPEISAVHLNVVGKVLLADAALLTIVADICGQNLAQPSRMGPFHPI